MSRRLLLAGLALSLMACTSSPPPAPPPPVSPALPPATPATTSTAQPSPPPRPGFTFTIERGKSVELPDGSVFTFDQHSHKMTMAGDPNPGPLIVRGSLTRRGGKPQDFEARGEGKSFEFEAGGERFKLLEYVYDSSMRLQTLGPAQGR